jgi:sec-independent protein translocase protein TatA
VVLCDNNVLRLRAENHLRAEERSMGDLLQPTHLLIIALVLLVFFGGRKLPELGKGLGEAMKGFREGIRGINDPPPPPPSAPTQQSAFNGAPQSATPTVGKANYRCPNCKNILTASAPNPNAAEDKGFCPECGSQFDKKAAQV